MKAELKTAIILGAGIAVTVAGISIAFSYVETNSFQPAEIISDGEIDEIKNIDKSNLRKAPEIHGITNYINTDPNELQKKIKDKVVLYDIWTYSCINCIRTLPYVTAWHEKYSDEGLVIVGIHSPEFEFEKNLDNVKKAVDKHGIKYPVVMDNDWIMWDAFDNRYWPRKYVADHEGYIRYDHIGEGAYKETEMVIQQLLKERAVSLGMDAKTESNLVDISEFEHTKSRSPELYFGYELAQGRSQLGNPEGFKQDTVANYSMPDELKHNHFYLDGEWKNARDHMELVSETGTIKLSYHAKQVNIVTGGKATLTVTLDGNQLPEKYAGNDIANGIVNITEPDLYNIINSNEASTHTLEIMVNEPGFRIYTFTFG
ncbi:MAG: redoxin domain-containing protein [Nitrosopumilaceae archaeon]|nr:redoxin domain-containing protein [Nitrosopumilaceae archaeon]NIU02114.1 redoxin domain-containing protein [Nitrosopumilaceae archaeon]NIU88506.1 redoxin domain-containing protein [Nitrosopumilaceae archaeon]NIV66748.1 redoxin domain-containing protein [Nitrosopumilaceae archaeon]NIX62715.1 redoxin domain-containing protein [Nitrosopumilaceae archaeon]